MKVRFSLIHNQQQIRTLNDLRQHCDLEQLLTQYRDGRLIKWLNQSRISDKDNLISSIEQIPNQIETTTQDSPIYDLEIIEKLNLILGIDKQKLADYEQTKLTTSKANFNLLDEYLKKGQWREADEETTRLMHKLGDKENNGYLDCKNFPQKELRIIDKLWLKYSNNHFGFSRQKQIYLQHIGNLDYNWDSYQLMCRQIGWKTDKDWLFYEGLTFNTNAPSGHFPTGGGLGISVGWEGIGVFWGGGLFIYLQSKKFY